MHFILIPNKLTQIGFKSLIYLACLTLKFDGWPRKTIGHLFYTMYSFVHHFKAIGEIKLELQSGHVQFRSQSVIFLSRVKDNKAPLLCHIKLCASSHHHMWIQTGFIFQKQLNWVLSFVTFMDTWPWPFAWTSLLSMVITTKNFMMIWWWKHSGKAVTDGQVDKRTVWTIHRAAW